jgi:hypothetical protein
MSELREGYPIEYQSTSLCRIDAIAAPGHVAAKCLASFSSNSRGWLWPRLTPRSTRTQPLMLCALLHSSRLPLSSSRLAAVGPVSFGR